MAVDRQRIYHKRDRLKQLRAFCYAARLRSITQAAERLGLSQPAVSLHVRELEHEFKALLFDRGGPRIALTAAGETLFRIVSPLAEEVDQLLLSFTGQLQDTTTGDLYIGASPGAAAYVLPPLLKSFRDLNPDIRIHMRRCLIHEGFRFLLADEVDFLIGPENPFPTRRGKTSSPISPCSFMTWCSSPPPPGHPLAGHESISREEAIASATIAPTPGTLSSQTGKWTMEAFGLDANVAIRAGGWGVIKRYVEAGLGAAVIPSMCVTPKDALSIVPLTQHFERRSYGVFFRTDRSFSPLAERFVELMEHRSPPPRGDAVRPRSLPGRRPQGRTGP